MQRRYIWGIWGTSLNYGSTKRSLHLKKERKRLTYLFLRVFFPFSFLVAILDILVLYYYTILQEVIATANYFRLQQRSTFFSLFFFFFKKKRKKVPCLFQLFFLYIWTRMHLHEVAEDICSLPICIKGLSTCKNHIYSHSTSMIF